MMRGETITTAIRDLPVSVNDIENVYITFHTITKTLLQKSLKDCVIDGEVIECTLSQEESLKFTCGPITRSVIVLTKSGARFELRDEKLFCGSTARNEVLL